MSYCCLGLTQDHYLELSRRRTGLPREAHDITHVYQLIRQNRWRRRIARVEREKSATVFQPFTVHLRSTEAARSAG